MRIYIIRHAEPDYENNTLTERGFKEADLLGKSLKDERIDYIYSSPLNRAKFTSDAIIKYKNGLTYEIKDWLHELHPYMWDLRCGELNDPRIYSLTECKETYDPNRVYENNLLSTADVEFDKILDKHGYKRNGFVFDVTNSNHDVIVFSCHGGIGSFLISKLLNVSPKIIMNLFALRPTSITKFRTEEREKGRAVFRMYEMGNCNHLYNNNQKPSFLGRLVECYDDKGRKYLNDTDYRDSGSEEDDD